MNSYFRITLQTIITLILILGCSILKSKTDRCFDVIDEYGKINLVIKDHRKTIFSCEDKNYNEENEE